MKLLGLKSSQECCAHVRKEVRKFLMVDGKTRLYEY